MRIRLSDKNLLELKDLLLDVEKAIVLIEREKHQREVAAQRKLERGSESAKKRKTPAARSSATPSDVPTVAVQSDTAGGANLERVVVKYMHPASRHLVWDGEGEQPDWLKAYLDRGGSWYALENAAEIFNARGKARRF